MNDNNAETKRKCVMCSKMAVVKYRPFCSIRCADLDLGKWLNESYVVSEPIDSDTAERLKDEHNADEPSH